MRAVGKTVQETACWILQTLGSCGGCQGWSRSEELCQGEEEGELQGEELGIQEEACLWKEEDEESGYHEDISR